MNSGDTVKIVLNYTIGGEALTEDFNGELEFSIGSKRYLLSNGGIVWDGEAFCVTLSQEDTIALSGNCNYQIRIKDAGGNVVSSGIEKLVIGKSISKATI